MCVCVCVCACAGRGGGGGGTDISCRFILLLYCFTVTVSASGQMRHAHVSAKESFYCNYKFYNYKYSLCIIHSLLKRHYTDMFRTGPSSVYSTV